MTEAAAGNETHVAIRSLDGEFERLVRVLRQSSPGESLRAWERLVEPAVPGLYVEFVWKEPARPDWEERRARALGEMLPALPSLAPQIRREFRELPRAVHRAAAKYREILGTDLPDVGVFGILSATFNGKVGSVGPRSRRTLAVFGVDVIAQGAADRRVVYAHELFHAIHAQLMDLRANAMEEETLLLALWLEGLATYASGRAVPRATRAAILMDRSLARMRKDRIARLSRRFVHDTERETPRKAQALYASWFLPRRRRPRHAPPRRAGYAVGLAVAELLVRRHSLREAIRWPADEARRRVREALAELAGRVPRSRRRARAATSSSG